MNSYMTRWLFFVILLIGVARVWADETKEQAIKRDRAQIKGVWKVLSVHVGGIELKGPQQGVVRKVVNGDDGTWRLLEDGKEVVKGGSTIDPTQNPKTIDFTSEDAKGKTFVGIYELGRDKRKLCFALQGGARPKMFAANPGTQNVLVTFERVAPEN